MDAWPDRQAQVMARWELAGSTGAVAGPLLLTAALASRRRLAGRVPAPAWAHLVDLGSAPACGAC